MNHSRCWARYWLVVPLLCAVQALYAQTGYDLTIKKPEPYDNRELKAEKTGRKKFTAPRHLAQNISTHFNYWFNAQQRLNEILIRVKESHRDDYSQLLPFFNYKPDALAQDPLLDSIIYKAKTGLVLHDLRNDWTDDLYLLWGQAYYYKSQLDSAYQIFQFINYAFAPKEKDGYYRFIGSNLDGNKSSSIATNEKLPLKKRIFSQAPHRNESLLWEVRTLTDAAQYAEAAALLVTLRNDPQFPKRLFAERSLEQAYLFYKQNIWDSAAHYLTDALPTATNSSEEARWEYLIAQLHERTRKRESANKFYLKSIAHTPDPVMEIWARLGSIRTNTDGGDKYVDENIEALTRMARKDKYEEYRAIIYTMAARMELDRGNTAAAERWLQKAVKSRIEGAEGYNEAFMLLADAAYDNRRYAPASSWYDSVLVQNLPTADAERLNERRTSLTSFVSNTGTISRQDSLQRIAALPANEQEAMLKKMVRQLRRQQGLREEEPAASLLTPADPFSTPAPSGRGNSNAGEWYFYNKDLRAAGIAQFKKQWGNRSNVDNWRRAADAVASLTQRVDQNRGTQDLPAAEELGPPTLELLKSQLPLTPETLQRSNDSLHNAFYNLAQFYNNIGDWQNVIATYEELMRRFPGTAKKETALFHIYNAADHLKDADRKAAAKQSLVQQFPGSRLTQIVSTGKDPLSDKPSEQITKTYEGIYDLFLSGKFAEAKEAKRIADSTYKTAHWSPQLLYIEAVYHIQQREDSAATQILNTLVQQNAGTPMAAKAENLVSVLKRRAQIEAELTAMQVTRPVEDTLFVEPVQTAPQVKKNDAVVVQKKDAPVVQPKVVQPRTEVPVKAPVIPKTEAPLFVFNADEPHYAVMVLNNVDVVFGNESKNAFYRYNRQKFYNQTIEGKLQPVNDSTRLLLLGPFASAQVAIDYLQQTAPVTAKEIVPWLKSDKFSFGFISERNLQAVLNMKDWAPYLRFARKELPVQF